MSTTLALANSYSGDTAWMTYVNGRIIALRTYRYSYWTHWGELANFFLPRRYRWFITPNQLNRGSPINQNIIDSTGYLAARNLAAGLMSGKTSPTRPWFKLKVGNLDDTQTSPGSLWLAECKRIMQLVFHESNFYNSIATWFLDLVIFGTASIIIYEDFDNVINCYTPCAGEYFVFIDGTYRPTGLAREFTMTADQLVDRFGLDNCSSAVQEIYTRQDGSGRDREIIVCHMIEPNTDGKNWVPGRFAFRECYWEFGGSQSPQSGPPSPAKFLETRGFFEQPQATCRWDLTSNEAYGRSTAMEALGDQKQLQVETRRKAQALDKMVNPPLAIDAQMKNVPASLLPGALNYIPGMMQAQKPGISSIYESAFPVRDVVEDLNEVRERIKYTFYNHLFQPLSQYETRSNITTVEIDQRKAEALIMLGPVFERIDNEGLKPIIERVFNICLRAGMFPPPPPDIAGRPIDIQFISILANAQDAIEASGIERTFSFAGNLAGADPQVMDCIDFDFGLNRYASLQGIDPRIMRMPEQVMGLRQQRAQQQAQEQQLAKIEALSAGAKNLAAADASTGGTISAALGGGPAA